jgi:hypothetical protein
MSKLERIGHRYERNLLTTRKNEKIFSDSVEAIKREYESKIRILEDHIKEIQTGL